MEVVDRQPEPTAVIRGTVPHGEVGPFIVSALQETAQALGGAIAGPPFCRMDMAEGGFALEVGFPVAGPADQQGPVEASTLPGGPTATLLHRGPYDGVAPAYGYLERWLAEHGLVPTGAPWEQYLDGPEVAEPRTVVCWPCRAATPGA